MKKIKVCFICPSVYPLFNSKSEATFGGAEVDVYLIAKELAKNKSFDISCIVRDFGQNQIETYDKVKLLKSFKFKENRIGSILKLYKLMKNVDADIYFQESASGGTGIISFFCKLHNKKFVYRTASDIDCNKTFIKTHPMRGILYKYGLKNADIVITQNEKNKEELKLNHDITSKVIRNVSEIDKHHKINKNFILWVGRNEELKKPELFIELAKSFPNNKFIMICPRANYNDVKNVEILAKKVKNLKFIRQVPFKNINIFFKKAKIFINTSDYEGFPNTFVQATANSTPIISLNVNPDNFLDKYKCGFCSKGNFELMKKQISQLLNDKKLYSQMSNNSYNYVKKNHYIKKIIKKYKRVFFDLMKNDKANIS